MIINKKRFLSIDLLKTISIFGVVFIHARNGNVITETISEMFRICVPIFIVFFSYFLEKTLSKAKSNKEVILILKKRFTVLFLPYFFFTIFYFFLLNDITTIRLNDLITGYWSGYGWPGQYFFIVLFQIIIIFPFVRKMANLKPVFIYALFTISILLYYIFTYILWKISIINMISDRIFIYWIPYTLLGILLNKHKDYFKLLSNGSFVILSLITIPLEFILLNKLEVVYSPYILITVLITSTLTSNYVVVKQTLIEGKMTEKMKQVSVFISKRSLGLFVLNPFVIYLFSKIPFSLMNYENLYISIILNLFFTLMVFGVTIFVVIRLEKTFLRKLVIS